VQSAVPFLLPHNTDLVVLLPNPEAEELAGLAGATGALLRAERALFSPALAHQLPQPDRAAAATLYHLFGQRLQPWLAKGALPTIWSNLCSSVLCRRLEVCARPLLHEQA